MKKYVIKQEGDEWVLYDSTGKKVLGRHKSKEEALAQERAIQARKGVFEALDITHDDLMLVHAFENDLHTFKDVDIFAVGTWRGINSGPEGDTYEEGDLDRMVEAFNERIIEPNIKITHGTDAEQVDIGKVANLRRVGKKLFADFVNVPKALYELMKKGLFKSRSSEVIWNLKKDGKTWPRVLKAVALLAPGQKPAVGALSEGYQFEALYCYEHPQPEKQKYQFEPPESGDAPKGVKDILAGAYNSCRSAWVKDHPSDKENAANKTSCSRIAWNAVEKAGWKKDAKGNWKKQSMHESGIDPFMEGVLLYVAQIEDEEEKRLMDEKEKKEYEDKLKSEKERAEAAEAKVKNFEETQKTARMKGIGSFIEQAKKEGKILPKEEAGIKKQFESLLEKNDEEGVENLKAYITAQQKRVEMGEKSKTDEQPYEYSQEKPAAQEVDRLARQYMADGKAKDYGAGLEAVRAGHKELWTKYLADK